MNQSKKYTIRDAYFWKITISLALASFFVFACMYAVQPLLPVFVEEFGVSVSESSLALSMTIVGIIIGLIVLGFYSDRMGRTMFIKLSLAGSVIPFLILPIVDSFYILVVLRFIQGFALAGLPAASLAYLSEEIDRRSVGVAIGLYISSNALGGMVGRVFTGYITDHYSWEMAFYSLAIVGLAILVVVLLMLPKSRFFQSSDLTFRKDIEGFLFHLRNPALLVVFGLGIVLQFAFTGVWTYLPFHLLAEPYSLSLEAISYTFLAYGLGVIGSPLAGWLAGKFGLSKIRIVGVMLLTIGICLTLSPSLILIVIGLCVSCLGFFTAHSLTATSVGEQATHHKGSAASLYLVSYYIGVALGSSALGPLWDAAGWAGLVIFTALLPVTYLLFIKGTNDKRKTVRSK
ncbi:YNFM family putative membrane transporter [Virgibacillus natechei]|uniref:YNFM family putative membrane transporter n=1 Tax=Virgibacillus natechei TaxID=1216297 RepID=A0ABS4IJV7_9BACI|nr:MFS transporter [Virgibacillus natechei]MBP1971204.1 YNFM family putative membrane transporter [Virgibacillus natechei]UZD11951.1 MFS transporter [Virgibacillus natechei]